MRQPQPMEHVGNGGERLHHDVAGRKRRLDLPQRDPRLAQHDGPQVVRVLFQQRTPRAADLCRGRVARLAHACMSLIAAEALTANRRAAFRIVLPPSTA